VIAEAVAFSIGVVAVHEKFIFSHAGIQAIETFGNKRVSSSFIGDDFSRMTAFGGGIFGVSPVDVQATGVG
jgi:hypothetical protein